ncbi:origin recognition complex, subunit 2 [Thamnocephalis sphaerospora]|uniref:Origin recognition complex subunit 2 n=1 Tax=Thamnocephalis sphaerospora TaxID=78915 RepID=A0A4P9XSL7_9FUNG|nr:origin recognition complex, subunit 2 [Thamnocephalis sphaerospora]|eukprot:RKP09126.1 origin recognition complex, subunit 2 [Thamnocephalis sphaerospora]
MLARPGPSRTSNNTLAALPTLERAEFRELIKNAPRTHTSEREQLLRLHRKQFTQWFFELRSGFSLLFYGFGSKRELLLQFARTMLVDSPLVVVNGFSPIVSPKEIIDKMASALPEAVRGGGTLLDQARRITRHLADVNASPDEAAGVYRRFYLLINNIECSGIQSERARAVIAALASSPYVHCIASIDHIQSGLLWDSSSAAQFRWVAHDVATFSPYRAETSYENPLLARADELDGRAARYVLSSLTSNARGMFRLLAERQLANDEDNAAVDSGRTGGGLAYSAFYTLCREHFLVSNDLTFRTQLTEYRDHRLILTRRSADGEDLFYIPFNATIIEALMEELA